MNTKPETPFVEFPKISRWNREVIVTEKIDGTNGAIYIDDTGERCFAGSRTRWITPEDDNYGFARWVRDNHDELLRLGPGSHFGEWWGQGIQRNYGLKGRRFSLFNVSRWSVDRPACCDVVPVLWRGLAAAVDVEATMALLAETGSVAAPGFMHPEGVVIFHVAGSHLYKMTLDKNDAHKGT
jgi:hypothetical protein